MSSPSPPEHYNFPNIKITEAEAEWLEQLYSAFKLGYKPRLKELKQHLQSQKKWRVGFKPYDLDNRLVENGNEITLLGIWQIEHDSDVIEKCDRVIKYLKQVVQRNPEIQQIKLSPVADILLLSREDLSRVLILVNQLGSFWSSASGPASSDDRFVTFDHIEISDPEVVDSYLAYQGIERLVWDFFNEHGIVGVSTGFRGSSTVPIEIKESLERFRSDWIGKKTAFLMMRFGQTEAHKRIVEGVRSALEPLGFTALRADEKQYHDDLFPNVLTYIYGCDFGIAVFERIEMEEFNPNVSLEVGYMSALRKDVCLLKDRTLKTLHTDLVGKLYRSFDPQSPESTIPSELSRWLYDKGLGHKP